MRTSGEKLKLVFNSILETSDAIKSHSMRVPWTLPPTSSVRRSNAIRRDPAVLQRGGMLLPWAVELGMSKRQSREMNLIKACEAWVLTIG